MNWLQRTSTWTSITIAVIWLAVLFDGVWGPSIVSNSATSGTTVPSVVVVAFFACLATAAVAHYGFGRRHD